MTAFPVVAIACPFRALALLAGLSVAGCAAPGASGDVSSLQELGGAPAQSRPPRAEIVAAAGRLPDRLALVFTRTRELASDGTGGLQTQYRLANLGAWATVYVYDGGHAAIPDGLASAALAEAHDVNLSVARGNAEGGVAQQMRVTIPGTSPQRCAVGRVTRDGRSIANYGCATGVRNVILKVRVTGSYPADNRSEQETLDKLVAFFLMDVTRVVAGQAPISVGTLPSPNSSLPEPQPAPTGRQLRL